MLILVFPISEEQQIPPTKHGDAMHRLARIPSARLRRFLRCVRHPALPKSPVDAHGPPLSHGQDGSGLRLETHTLRVKDFL